MGWLERKHTTVNCRNQAITLIEGWAAPAPVNECNGDFSPIDSFEQKEASLGSTSSTLISCLSCARLAVDS
jgi:hypothetical protein